MSLQSNIKVKKTTEFVILAAEEAEAVSFTLILVTALVLLRANIFYLSRNLHLPIRLSALDAGAELNQALLLVIFVERKGGHDTNHETTIWSSVVVATFLSHAHRPAVPQVKNDELVFLQDRNACYCPRRSAGCKYWLPPLVRG